jgi:hypothetical protein
MSPGNHSIVTEYTDTKTTIKHIKIINLVTFNEIYLKQNLD